MNSVDLKHTTVDRIVRLARIDPRLCGSLLLGAAAQDPADECDRIHLCMIVYNDHAVPDVFADWQRRLCAILPVLSVESTADAPDRHTLSLLLGGPVEIWLRFICASDLQAAGALWQVLFDRIGDLDWRMKVLWVKKTAARRVVPEYEQRMASIKHRMFLAQAALENGRLWQAIIDIGDIRKQVIDLHGLRTGEDAIADRDIDNMEPPFLATLAPTVCTALTRAEAARALQAVIECFLAEIRAAEQNYELDAAPRMENLLQDLPCCV